MSKAKRNALLLLIAAGILTLILVMSLSKLTLSSGRSFSLESTDSPVSSTEEITSGDEGLLWILRGFIALAIIGVPIYIVVSLFSAKGRRRLLANLILVAFLFWLLNYIESHPIEENPRTSEVMADDTGELAESTSPTIFTEDEAPAWLATVVILVAALVGAGLLGVGVWFFQQRTKHALPLPLDSLAETAQDTIESLQAGGDFRTAIIQCYYEMNRVIKLERGISRETTTTPREFETYLIKRGLPKEALATLTRLFEQVRYGNAPSRTDDEALAVDCLTKIVDSCKMAKIAS
ncbi:MAG: DUF4129 domain-containing protein [Anaerolineae bacterium]|nr:DUF4129 domain-containing protein [Anaerolineae bacterium]